MIYDSSPWHSQHNWPDTGSSSRTLLAWLWKFLVSLSDLTKISEGLNTSFKFVESYSKLCKGFKWLKRCLSKKGDLCIKLFLLCKGWHSSILYLFHIFSYFRFCLVSCWLYQQYFIQEKGSISKSNVQDLSFINNGSGSMSKFSAQV